MHSRRQLFLTFFAAIAALGLLFYAGMIRNAQAAPTLAGYGISAPSNGTASELNLTFNPQQWVGFYGNLSMNITTASGNNLLFSNYISNGTVYVVNHGESPVWTSLVISPPDAFADGNYSLTGAYLTSLMGFQTYPILSGLCGISPGLFYVNTTDNIPVGILKDGNSTHNYLLCSPVVQVSSGSSALGTSYDFAVIAPSTPNYGGSNGYDLYYEGGIVNTT